MSYLRKPFKGEAGMVPLLRGERSLKTLSKLSSPGENFECFLK